MSRGWIRIVSLKSPSELHAVKRTHLQVGVADAKLGGREASGHIGVDLEAHARENAGSVSALLV
eukprot:1157210-Pelagomonas_calceolata.AAC.5